MKKILMFAVAAMFALGSVFAQDADEILAEVAAEEQANDPNAVQTIEIEDNEEYKQYCLGSTTSSPMVRGRLDYWRKIIRTM